MSRKFQAVSLAMSLIVTVPAAAQPPSGAAELATGIRQVDEGDLEAAVLTLDGAVQRLSAEKGREKDLARAYVYLAVAHLGLGRTEDAKAKLREAWKADHDTRLDSRKFSPRLIQLYEQARQEGNVAPPATATTTPSAPAREKKGGGTKWLLVGGGLAAVGIGVAAAAGGGGADAPSAPPAGPATVTFPLGANAEINRTITMSAAGPVSVSVTVGSAFVHLFSGNCTTGTCVDVANTCQPGPCLRSGPNVLQATMPAGTNTLYANACPLVSGCTITVTHPR